MPRPLPAESEPPAEEEYQFPEPEEAKPAFGQILGASSLVVDILGLMFLILPCFWFLALPVSALGLMLGFIGVFWKKGRALSIAGLVMGAIMVLISGVLVLWAQVSLAKGLEGLRNLR